MCPWSQLGICCEKQAGLWWSHFEIKRYNMPTVGSYIKSGSITWQQLLLAESLWFLLFNWATKGWDLGGSYNCSLQLAALTPVSSFIIVNFLISAPSQTFLLPSIYSIIYQLSFFFFFPGIFINLGEIMPIFKLKMKAIDLTISSNFFM